MTDPHPRRLLVRGVNWLGDAVMTTPALLQLREALPSTHIALLTRAKLADLWTAHPAINEVVTVGPEDTVWAVGRKLRIGRFDTALVLPNSPRSALEMWLARIPRRIGYARPWRNWLLTDVVPTRPGHVKMHKRNETEVQQLVGNSGNQSATVPAIPPEAHQMHEYLHLAGVLEASEAPRQPSLAVETVEVEAALAKFDLPREGRWFGLNAGAEYGPAKRWPKGRFIAAARAIQERTGCGCLIFGGKGDVEVADEITFQLQSSSTQLRNVAGRSSLRELMALLTRCCTLLTNDTGPMHLAAALGVPVVVPFGSTSPELTGPGLPGDARHRLIKPDVACSPCFLRECPIDFRCMNGISVDRVVDMVVQVLAET